MTLRIKNFIFGDKNKEKEKSEDEEKEKEKEKEKENPVTHKFPTKNWSLDSLKMDKLHDTMHHFRKLTRKDFFLDNLSFFTVSSLLWENEAKYLVSKVKKEGFKSIDWEYTKEYRDCERLVIMAPKLADHLWNKVKGLIDLADIMNIRPYGFDNQGIWVPQGVNPCIRFSKYSKGGMFKKHKDGAFVLDDDNRSILTLHIYLNAQEEFQGGETVFYSSAYQGPSPRNELKVNIQPEIGKAIIFHHDLDHEALPVTTGFKYILRTDIMFRRVFNPKPSERYLLNCNPDFLKCDELYNLSVKLQKDNQPKESTQAYLDAQSIMALLPSKEAVKINPFSNLSNSNWKLNYDLTCEIFQYLNFEELLKVTCVCKAWKLASEDGSLWSILFKQKFGRSNTLESMIGQIGIAGNSIYPWKLRYLGRLDIDKRFRIVYVDLGSETTRFGMIGKRDELKSSMYYTDYDTGLMTPPKFKSIAAKVKGHYWSARSGLDDFIVGQETKDSPYSRNERYSFLPRHPFSRVTSATPSAKWLLEQNSYTRSDYYVNRPTTTSNGKISIEWDIVRAIIQYVFSSGFGVPQSYNNHPILIAVPPFFQEFEVELLKTLLLKDLTFHKICLVHQAVLILLSENLLNGLVVSSGHLNTSITPVIDGKALKQYEKLFPVSGIDIKDLSGLQIEERVTSLFFNSTENLAQVALDCVLSCPEEIRFQLINSIVLSGLNMNALVPEVIHQMRKVFNAAGYDSVSFILPKNFEDGVINGARAMSQLSNSRQFFLDQSDFEFREISVMNQQIEI